MIFLPSPISRWTSTRADPLTRLRSRVFFLQFPVAVTQQAGDLAGESSSSPRELQPGGEQQQAPCGGIPRVLEADPRVDSRVQRKPGRWQSYPADVTTAAVTRNFAADSGRRFTSAPTTAEDDVVTDRRRMRRGGGDYDGRVAQRMKDSGRQRTIGSDTNVRDRKSVV